METTRLFDHLILKPSSLGECARLTVISCIFRRRWKRKLSKWIQNIRRRALLNDNKIIYFNARTLNRVALSFAHLSFYFVNYL